jgi:hypothetical protein
MPNLAILNLSRSKERASEEEYSNMHRITVFPAKLTDRERRFLAMESIHPRWVLDASRYCCRTLVDCYWMMKTTSTTLAVGFRRCEYGHRIMNSRGNCVQCNPRLLQRTRRWIRDGYVYLASSESTNLIKLGSCQDLDERTRTLRNHCWAGTSDWRMRAYYETLAAEMLEHDISKRLLRFQVETEYKRYGRDTYTREVFACSYRTAKKHFDEEIRSSETHYRELEEQCLG